MGGKGAIEACAWAPLRSLAMKLVPGASSKSVMHSTAALLLPLLLLLLPPPPLLLLRAAWWRAECMCTSICYSVHSPGKARGAGFVGMGDECGLYRGIYGDKRW